MTVSPGSTTVVEATSSMIAGPLIDIAGEQFGAVEDLCHHCAMTFEDHRARAAVGVGDRRRDTRENSSETAGFASRPMADTRKLTISAASSGALWL